MVGTMGRRNNGLSEQWVVGIMTRNRIHLLYFVRKACWKIRPLKSSNIITFVLNEYSRQISLDLAMFKLL